MGDRSGGPRVAGGDGILNSTVLVAWGRGAVGSASDWQSEGQGFESPRVHQCRLSGHSSRLLQDIVHRPAAAEWLVVAEWVEGQSTDEFAVVADDADVRTGDEQTNPPVPVCAPDRDVTEPAQVANGDLTEGVNLVSAAAVVG